MANLHRHLHQCIKARVETGLRPAVRAMVPVRTGALRRSVKFRTLERHGGIALRVELLDYFRNVQRAVGVPNKNLTAAISGLMVKTLRSAIIDAVENYFLEAVGSWGLPRQNRYLGNVPGSVRVQVKFYLVNSGS